MPNIINPPELQNYWYDRHRNRFFRISQGDVPPPQVYENTKTFRRKHQMSLLRLLDNAQMRPTSNNQLPAATMLAGSPARRIIPSRLHGLLALSELTPNDAKDVFLRIFADRNPSNATDMFYLCLLSHPEGKVIAWISFIETSHVYSSYWDPQQHMICCLQRNIRGQGQLWLSASVLGDGRKELVPVSKTVSDMSKLAGSDAFTCTGEGHTWVYKLNTFGGALHRYSHGYEGTGMVVKYPKENMIWTGTRRGSVLAWDDRSHVRGQSPVKFRPSGERNSVVDIEFDGNCVYTSCLGNAKNNLSMWDLRKLTNGPVLTYLGHKNAYKKYALSMNLNAGLLVSGGDNGYMRIWNVRTGGECIAERKFSSNEMVSKVQLAGWDSGEGIPGAWVSGARNLYNIQLGGKPDLKRDRIAHGD